MLKPKTIKGWKCPECGSINREEIALCECGYDSNRPFHSGPQKFTRPETNLVKRAENLSYLTLKNQQPTSDRNNFLIASLGVALVAVVLLNLFPLPSEVSVVAGTILSLTIMFIIDRLFTVKEWTHLRNLCVHAVCLSCATILILFYSKPDAFKVTDVLISILFGLALGVVWIILIYRHINKSISLKKGSFIFFPVIILLTISAAYLETKDINADIVAFLSMAIYSLVALLGVHLLENKLKKAIHIEVRPK